MYTCQHCGRNNFKAAFGLSNHINGCKAAKSGTIIKPAPPRADRTVRAAPDTSELYKNHVPTDLDNLQLVKRPDGWWITGGPDDIPDMGPYATKDDAHQERAGLQRTWRNMTRPHWVTTK